MRSVSSVSNSARGGEFQFAMSEVSSEVCVAVYGKSILQYENKAMSGMIWDVT